VAVTANPWTPEKVKPGIYEGVLEIRGTGVSSQNIPLFVSLQGREYKWAGIAFGLLTSGALLGLLLKWITERLTPQAALIRRLNALKRAINYRDDGSTLPVEEQMRLDNLEDQIAREDYAGAENSFKEIEERKFELATVSSQFDLLMDYLATQSELIRSSGNLSPRDRIRLNGILDEEYRHLRQLQTEERSELKEHFKSCKDDFATISSAMFHYVKRPNDNQLREVMDRYQLGDFSEGTAAFKEWSRVTPDGQDVAGVVTGESQSSESRQGLRRNRDVSSTSSRPSRNALRGYRQDDHPVAFIFRHARAIAGVTSILVVALVGLKLEYLDNQVFNGDLADWLALGLWGTAIELSGVSVLEVIGRLGASSTPGPASRA
jgi:hypothetical protein